MENLMERWLRFCSRLNTQQDPYSPFMSILKQYNTRLRRCYTIDWYVPWWLGEFEMVRSFASRQGELELAGWCHRAVWSPGVDGNEERSGLFAVEIGRMLGLPEYALRHAQRLVLATKPGAPAKENDEILVADISNFIYGLPMHEYCAFEEALREEHAFLNTATYNKLRLDTLRRFLNQGYHLPQLRERFGENAQNNITWTFSLLGRNAADR